LVIYVKEESISATVGNEYKNSGTLKPGYTGNWGPSLSAAPERAISLPKNKVAVVYLYLLHVVLKI
jgi:hypothetical protein